MTGILDSLLAFFVAGLLNLLVISRIRVHSPSERGFLVRVYLWTVGLRYAFAVILNVFVTDPAVNDAFWGDSRTYDAAGYLLSRRWSGEPVASGFLSTAVSGFGWGYFVGFIYYVFGRNQLLVQLLNGLMGGLTVLVIYALAARLFDRAVARWAALFMAFFPQMVFWSTGMYKDPAVLLCIASSMYAVLRLRERFTLSMALLFVAAMFGLITLRFYIAYFVAFAGTASFAFGQRQGTGRMVVTYGLLAGLLFGVLNLAVKRETLEIQSTYMTLERVQVTRDDQAMWGRSGFGHDIDVSTPGGALAALPVGLLYLLFAPFPWAVSGLRQALVLPETLVWYALMPAFARGLWFSLKRHFWSVLPIAVFAFSLTLAYALMQGNVGTAYRQRTQVTMFFFIFMAAGVVQKQRQREVTAARPAAPLLS
jgi:4-amino-4-deoxy-L-arabinose transferase-like glycosyltransferase